MSGFGKPVSFQELLNEDGQGGVLKPSPLTLADICGLASEIQQIDGTAPKTLPYPGEFVLEELADIYLDVGKLDARLKQVKLNAAIATNSTAKENLEKVLVTINSMKKLCKVAAKQLDGLTLDKTLPET